MDLVSLRELIGAIAGVRVLAVGDLMVDRFVYGDVGRVSAEAPVPVLARTAETVMLGVAGTVARNLAVLGGAAALVGVVGDDSAAHEAMGLIEEQAGIEGFLVTDPARATTVKTRFVAAGQQLLRVDLEHVSPVEGAVEARLVRTIADAAVGCGAILLSDYGKGVVSPAVIEACLAAARRENAVLVVDSKARGFGRYGPADVIKPNAAELAHATDLPTGTNAEVEAALHRALELCDCGAVLVTRAAKGMSLAVRGAPVRHFRRAPPEVFDTAGAGDTALAALGLALAARVPIGDAVAFALLASSVAVERAGTAAVAPEELIEAEIAAHRAPLEAKIATPARMVREVARWRERGLRIGFTNGGFDILHLGHIACLAEAKGWCDKLIVGVNTDRSVRATKGAGRPVNDLEARALVLAGLAGVDLVVAFDEDTPLCLIAVARPDVLIKGADYASCEVIGGDLVKGWGGEVRLAAFVEGQSTTATLRRLSDRA
ncbi:MAG: PfkB family carbohydrate kinase [Caulobacteraceae bacterium]